MSQHGVTFANIHLIGERYTDRDIAKTSREDRYKWIDTKLELLHKVLECIPDVILGDFTNEQRLNRALNAQKNHIDKLTDEIKTKSPCKTTKVLFGECCFFIKNKQNLKTYLTLQTILLLLFQS